jgi:hypothetical protein
MEQDKRECTTELQTAWKRKVKEAGHADPQDQSKNKAHDSQSHVKLIIIFVGHHRLLREKPDETA